MGTMGMEMEIRDGDNGGDGDGPDSTGEQKAPGLPMNSVVVL